MSFYCENCEERGEAAESEIDRLRRELAEAQRRVDADVIERNRIIAEKSAELAEARDLMWRYLVAPNSSEADPWFDKLRELLIPPKEGER